MKTIVLKQLHHVLSHNLHRTNCKTSFNNFWDQNKIKVLLILLFSITSTTQVGAQSKSPTIKNSGWMAFGTSGNEALLSLKTSESFAGDGAFFEIKNDSEKDVTLKYVIQFKNGKSEQGTIQITNDDKSPKIACANCQESIGQGIAKWTFEDIQFK